LVCDVGAVYDPATLRFDHHQREFTDFFSPSFQNSKLSSAGLIYKHFGKEILTNILALESESSTSEASSSLSAIVDCFYDKIYKDFMEHIDAIDNGVSVSSTGEVKYHISTTLSARVNHLNPAWNEPFTAETLNESFKQAMLLTGNEFFSYVIDLYRSWWPARSVIANGLSKRYEEIEENTQGNIIVLSIACPWKDHLFDLEEKVESSFLLPLLFDCVLFFLSFALFLSFVFVVRVIVFFI
jgi:uncharacterized UPF0160 family protein